MAGVGNEMPHVVQVGRRFQEFAAGRRQLVQRLQRGEQQAGDVGHFARVLERHAVAPAHLLHLAALIAVEAGKLGAHVARRQVGDDAVAHAGARIEEGGQVESPRNSSSTATPGTMISARRGPMPVTLRRPAGSTPRASRRACAPARWRCAGGRFRRAWSAATRATALATAEAVAEVAIARSQPVCPSRATGLASFSRMYSCIWWSWRWAGGSSLRKISRRRTAPSGLENASRQAAAFAGDNLRAAASDIEDQDAFPGLRPVALDAQVNQARLFAAGDDLDGSAGGFRGARDEIPLVARIADGAGGHRAHTHDVQPAVDAAHAGQYGAGGFERLFADGAGAKYALTEARDFALGGQNADRLSGHHFRGLHTDGVAADVDGCVTGHVSMLPWTGGNRISPPAPWHECENPDAETRRSGDRAEQTRESQSPRSRRTRRCKGLPPEDVT